MKLLFLSNVFPGPLHPTKGPFNRSLVRALAESHAVRVVSPVSWCKRLAGRWRRATDPASVEMDGVPVTFPTFYYPPKLGRSRYDDWMTWSLRRPLEQVSRDFQPQAILSYWVHPDGACATRLARELGIPSIVMTGGSDVLLLGRSGARRTSILKTLAEADAVITVSDHLRSRLVHDGVDAAKIHVVHRGLDRSLFHPQPIDEARQRLYLPLDRRLIVGVGRLVPVKGWELLIDACSVLHQRGRKFGCVIVGGGELHQSLEKRIADLGLEQVVTLGGARPQTELADWYRAADVVALTSLSEGIPNVLLEAMNCGTRWVATDVGGVREIADPAAHLVLSGRDPVAYADAIEANWTLERVDPRTLAFQPDDWESSAARVGDIVAECVASKSGGSRAGHKSNLTPVTVGTGGTPWA
jgi:teichuronic acid biosynthesis glycosyltransferase TuaC